ncbi:glutathione peroxidase [Flavobacterium sp. xlx-214]|uniref:glutathione peroxidase n=1 Tax=unclassified Flavobacterium TaxID=196869 RepID=UPI0013D62E2B|nr:MULTISPECIES: glutathione peroxidase [unclassified Flavobacterium]MBA5791868.1 glutathione peroxidase [Flavobacterium sp. xlx-221]QMI83105.1 glutathione peroxidase [Flavobacterium sp. xlx-214]
MKEIYHFKVKSLQGVEIDFASFKNKTLLIVNTASKCGFTPQYKGLEALYQKYKDKGLVVLAFPCNQFNNQEPGNATSIQNNCLINYGVSFPVFEKVLVNGKNAHPLFKFLKAELPGFITNGIKWNFTKFLIDKNGNPIKRFSTFDTPDKIESFLLKKQVLE